MSIFATLELERRPHMTILYKKLIVL
jgi:hypothetical protein